MTGQSMFSVLTAKVRQALQKPAPHLPPLPGTDRQAIDSALDALDSAALQVDEAPDFSAWMAATDTWRDALIEVATQAYDPDQLNLQPPADELFARFLLVNFPRTAATLILVGAITVTTDNATDPTQTHYRVHWDRVQAFFTDPLTLVNRNFWNDLLDDTGAPGSGRLIAVLVALIIMAPQTLLALVDDQFKVAALAPPLVSLEADPVWANFREFSADWFSITLPLADPTEEVPNPASAMAWVSGLNPDFSGTFALRANDAGDFEAWLAFAMSQAYWRTHLGGDWYLQVEPGITAGFGWDSTKDQWFVDLAANDPTSPLIPVRDEDPISVRLYREPPDGKPDLQLGPSYDTRFIIQDLELFAKLRKVEPYLEIGFLVEGLALVLTNRLFRTFGKTHELLREGIRLDLDLAFSFDILGNINLNTDGGLETLFYINYQIGDATLNFKLHSLRLIIEFEVEMDSARTYWGVRAHALLHLSGQLWCFGVVIDGVGLWGGFWPKASLCPYIGVPLPTGLGLSLDLREHGVPLLLEGYMEWSGGDYRYAGMFRGILYTVEVTAFGIYDQTEDGDTSLLIVFGVIFKPGIPVGYGFQIVGIGGLIGMNRRLDTDALRERLTSGAAGNVLFSSDPFRDAPIILGDLDALFPVAQNITVVGPTLRFAWLIVNFDVGLLVEYAIGTNMYETGGITKVIILGSAKAELGLYSLKFLNLRMDVVGFIDLVREVVEFDATMYNSTIFDFIYITGDAAFRLSWGAEAYAMLTLGGFHPAFNPEPAQFPMMARIGTYVEFETSVFDFWMRQENYLAFTTNSIQTGANVEAELSITPFTVYGWFGYDVLIQFQPFFFSFEFRAGFALKAFGMTFAGVSLAGLISGPGPITLAGRFSIELLFFEISWNDSITLGSSAPDTTTSTISLVEELAGELAELRNLAATGGEDRFAIANTSKITNNGAVIVSPFGGLVWSQQRAPLNCLVSRFEGAPLPEPQAVIVEAVLPGENPLQTGSPLEDWFSAGSFSDLTDSEALNKAPFERLEAGFNLTLSGMETSQPVGRNLDVNTYVLPDTQPTQDISPTEYPELVLEAVEGRSAGTNSFPRRSALLQVRNETWSVYTPAGSQVVSGTSQTDAHQWAAIINGTALPDGDIVDLGDLT